MWRQVKQAIAGENAGMILISAAIEAEIADLESFEDRQMFLQEMGLEQSGVEKLIHAAYKLLNYITYFTVGVKGGSCLDHYRRYQSARCSR